MQNKQYIFHYTTFLIFKNTCVTQKTIWPHQQKLARLYILYRLTSRNRKTCIFVHGYIILEDYYIFVFIINMIYPYIISTNCLQ